MTQPVGPARGLQPGSKLLVTIALCVLALVLVIAEIFPALPQRVLAQGKPLNAQITPRTYLPFITAQDHYPPSVFGVQPDPFMFQHNSIPIITPYMASLPVTWVRYDGVHWAEIEPVPGERNWEQLETFERDIRELNNSGLTPIVVVGDTPSWAQKIPGYQCGPIRKGALDDFAVFMKDLAARYNRYPTRVDYWEIWNEPDVDPSLVKKDSNFGCWGDESQTYYGGEYFGKMLQQVYPAVKTSNSKAQIVTGGLLLDCDPENPPPGKDCHPSRFIEGVLRQAPDAFDIMEFHGYAYWWPSVKEDWDLSHHSWGHRGGVTLGQLDYLNKIQQDYGIDKPVIAGESGLVCHESNPDCPSEELFNAQANYIVRLYTRAFAHDLFAAIWFTMDSPGWRWGALLDYNYQPRPAYNSYNFITSILRGAQYLGQLSQGELEGYQLRLKGSRYKVFWSNHQDKTFTIALPVGEKTVYDKFGTDITPSGQSLNIGFEPRIIMIPW